MTMHLVGPALSMNSTKKRKTKGLTARDRQAQADHDMYLKSLGVEPKKRNVKENFRAFTDTSTFNNPRTPSRSWKKVENKVPYMGNGKQISWKEKQERLAVSSQYSIAPAYNKGPYMVVAKEDLKTAGKKV